LHLLQDEQGSAAWQRIQAGVYCQYDERHGFP
jgi:hypothetical protein